MTEIAETDRPWAPFNLLVEECGEMDRPLSIKVFDHTEKDCRYELIGKFETTLLELIQPTNIYKLKKLKSDKKVKGYLRVDESMPFISIDFPRFPIAKSYHMKIKATKIARLDPGLTKQQRLSDPYLKFFTIPYGSNDYTEVYKTDYIKNVREAEWEVTLTIEELGGLDSPIRIECWDDDQKRNMISWGILLLLLDF